MVETWEGTDRLTFQYDYMGRRVEKKVYDGQTLTTHLKFVYDGFKLVEELDALNGDTPLRRYTWQPDDVGLDVVLQMMDVPGNTYSFHLHDANKNVMQNVDIIGYVAKNYLYSPYGLLISPSSAYVGFSSEYLDKETRLVYYNFRYYLPIFSFLLCHDPIYENGGINLYNFTRNNPICLYEELGLHGIPGSGLIPTMPQNPSDDFEIALRKIAPCIISHAIYKNCIKKHGNKRCCKEPSCQNDPLDCIAVCSELYQTHPSFVTECTVNCENGDLPLPIPAKYINK